MGGTPTFFVNGKPLVGAQPYDIFKRVLDAILPNVTATALSTPTVPPIADDDPPLNDADGAIKLAPASALTPELLQLPERAQIAYRFALANQDVLTKIPCYCGCVGVGHEDNRMCYIRSDIGDEQIVFDNHASL